MFPPLRMIPSDLSPGGSLPVIAAATGSAALGSTTGAAPVAVDSDFAGSSWPSSTRAVRQEPDQKSSRCVGKWLDSQQLERQSCRVHAREKSLQNLLTRNW